MVDIVSSHKRSEMMSGIRGKDTRPEQVIRKALHSQGYRYRLHSQGLPGKPDLVFPKYRAVIFVHGCFWHGHDCHLFKWPKSRMEFWRAKITGNRKNDMKCIKALQKDGWRVLTIWECAIKGKTRIPVDEIIGRTSKWMTEYNDSTEIRGC